MRRQTISAFTLLELVTVLLVVTILAVLMVGEVKRGISRAESAKCVGNFRQLGAAASAYAADNNNQWPYSGEYTYPDDQQAWINRKVRVGNVWTGLGKTYPYHLSKKLFYCPADRSGTIKAMDTADWRVDGAGSIDGSYLVRGYGQTSPRPLGKNYATLGRRAIASCQWAYAASSPVKLPLAFHDSGYPVLFSDGSVETISFPKDSVDRENPPSIWDKNSLQIDVWEFFDGKLKKELKLK